MHLTRTTEYGRTKEKIIRQRSSRVPPYLEAARKSLQELSKYSQQQGIILGLETRFHFHEIPNIDEMAELLDEMAGGPVGYWHDVGHAEVQQRLGFSLHEQWLSRYKHRMVGIHLHDVLGISDHRPPGKGDVNWSMMAECLLHNPGRINSGVGGGIPTKVIKVCELAEWNEEGEIRGVVNFLQKEGVIS